MTCNRISKYLKCNLIGEHGQETIIKRYQGNEGAIQPLDMYGEPIGGEWVLPTGVITIVIIRDKRYLENTVVGGLPEDTNKEVLAFYVAADVRIQNSDKIVYPPNTESEWKVYWVEPTYFGGKHIITTVKARRDIRGNSSRWSD
jgi:hypothetical protein